METICISNNIKQKFHLLLTDNLVLSDCFLSVVCSPLYIRTQRDLL